MAYDPDNIIAPGTSVALYTAPIGTAMPTDILTALNAAFVDLGATTDVSVTPSLSTETLDIAQSIYPARRWLTSRELNIEVTLFEVKTAVLKEAFGGIAVTVAAGVSTAPLPSTASMTYRALFLQWADGTKDYRWAFPRVFVSDVGSIPVGKAGVVQFPVTWSVEMADGVAPGTLLSDDVTALVAG